MPAVTMKAPTWSASALARGATKSASAILAGRSRRAGELLAQRVQHRDRRRARFVAVEEDIVAVRVGRPESEHRASAQPTLGCHALEHRLGVVEQAARGRAVFGVVEDGGKLAGELPGGEERRP